MEPGTAPRRDEIAHDLLAIASGSIVGFVLGLVGGGGSILAVPLLVYVVGVPSPHIAIGTSAIAVALSAAANLAGHARAQNREVALRSHICDRRHDRCGRRRAAWQNGGWRKAVGFVRGFDDYHRHNHAKAAQVCRESRCQTHARKRVANAAVADRFGLAVGVMSGFFGIGGGFLIVPGLIGATAMPLINAIGSSLVSVTVFGLTTATSYAWSGFVDWCLRLFHPWRCPRRLSGYPDCTYLSRHKHADALSPPS